MLEVSFSEERQKELRLLTHVAKVKEVQLLTEELNQLLEMMPEKGNGWKGTRAEFFGRFL